MNILGKIALLAAFVLAACNPMAADQPAVRAPLAGARIGGPFTLTDQNGHVRSDRDFAGKYRIVYFGYTFCPDVCPVDMQNVGAALKQLDASDPALARRIVPIFISVDPARDTPPVLKEFVSNFHPRMIGLTGSPEAVARAAKEFAIFYSKGEPSTGGGYMVNHSRQTYLMDPDGRPLALLPSEQGPDAIVAEIKRWVR